MFVIHTKSLIKLSNSIPIRYILTFLHVAIRGSMVFVIDTKSLIKLSNSIPIRYIHTFLYVAIRPCAFRSLLSTF